MAQESGLIVAVGTSSEHKLSAVGAALFSLGAAHTILPWPSGEPMNMGRVAAQPSSMTEGFEGAMLRALAAARKFGTADIGVGIESAVVTVQPYGTFDISCLAIVGADGKEWYGTSAGMLFPKECVVAARERGFTKTTVGQVIAEQFGGDQTDPHSTLTGGRASRQNILTEGLKTLFARYLADTSSGV